jgi:hypothetical protein
MKPKTISVAAGLLLAISSRAQQNTIYSGTGFGTYYYDMQQVDVCGQSLAGVNAGPVKCQNSNLALNDINSNYLVAMNITQLGGNMALYCGKKVVVTSLNGQPVSTDLPLYIGDGCERCSEGSAAEDQTWNSNGSPGLDFSYSVLNQLSGGSGCDGHFAVTWEILDEQLYEFDTDTGAAAVSTSPPAAPATSKSPAPAPPAPPAAPAGGAADDQPAAVIPPSRLSSSPTAAITAAALVHYQQDDKVPAAPTTLIPTQLPSTTTATTTTTTMEYNIASSCASGAWQCGSANSVLEQCISGVWTPRATCVAGEECQGGDVPYCAPRGFGQSSS